MNKKPVHYLLTSFNEELVKDFFPNQYLTISILLEERNYKEALVMCKRILKLAEDNTNDFHIQASIILTKELFNTLKEEL